MSKYHIVTCFGGAWKCSGAAYKRVLKALRDDGQVDLDRVAGCKYMGSMGVDVTDGLDDDTIARELDKLRSK